MKLIAIGSGLGLVSPWLSSISTPYSSLISWLFDLASHWQWLYLTCLSLCLLTFIWRRQWHWLLLAPLLVLPWFSVSPALEQAKASAHHEGVLRLISANLAQSQDASQLQSWLARQPADLILLQEVTPELANQISEWSEFPHQLLAPDDSPFGLALLSRTPLESAQLLYDEHGIPHIEASFELAEQMVQLKLIHPMPPLSPLWQSRLNHALEEALSSSQNAPALVAGDFNASPWAYALRQRDQDGWYRANNLRPTWPAIGHGWLGIAIDQIMAKGPWRVLEQTLGPNLGSDHLPRYLQLQLQQ